MLKKLDKMAPRAQIALNVYQSSKDQLRQEREGQQLCFQAGDAKSMIAFL
jgi:hypothetical protein